MQLPNDIESCHRLIESLLGQLIELTQKVAVLEGRLNQNSKNSSKPPSTDRHKSKRRPGIPKVDKSRGGQSGHKGDMLKMVSIEEVDEISELYDYEGIMVYDCWASS